MDWICIGSRSRTTWWTRRHTTFERGRVAPADRESFRRWLARFDGQSVDLAVEGCTGWRFIVEECHAAGVRAHARGVRGPLSHEFVGVDQSPARARRPRRGLRAPRGSLADDRDQARDQSIRRNPGTLVSNATRLPDLPPMARSGQAGVRCMAGGPRRSAAWTRPLCCRCSRLRQRRVAPRALRISSVRLPPPWPASPRTRSALPGQAWCRCHAVSRGLETS